MKCLCSALQLIPLNDVYGEQAIDVHIRKRIVKECVLYDGLGYGNLGNSPTQLRSKEMSIPQVLALVPSAQFGHIVVKISVLHGSPMLDWGHYLSEALQPESWTKSIGTACVLEGSYPTQMYSHLRLVIEYLLLINLVGERF